jgi:hypothetical protein
MALVCEGLQGRETLRRNGVTRYLPVYPDLQAAFTAVHKDGFQRPRRRARADIPRSDTSVQQARALTVSWLTDWDLSDYVTNVSIAVTVLVENAVAHTEGVFALRLEAAEMGVTVAVEDSSGVAAMRGESVDQPTVTALMPGPTETNFFHRARMDDTPVGKMHKDDPAQVARQGFEALMRGEQKVVGGSVSSKAMGTVSRFLPDKVKAIGSRIISVPFNR